MVTTELADRDRDVGVGLSVAAVAARVGVATSTLRSWERRYGVGPSRRSTGGHRRYTSADVALLQRLHRLVRSGVPTATAAALALAPVPAPRARPPDGRHGVLETVERQFAAASEALDSRSLSRLAALALSHHGAVKSWDSVFAPQLRSLGERWARTGVAIEREHVTAAVVQAALTRHAERHRPKGAPITVLAAATQNEQHTLPLDALAAALAENGVATLSLGSLPPAALHTAISDTAPAAVVLWARGTASADVRTLRGLLRITPVVCAAGPGWKPRRLPSGITHLPDLAAAVDTMLDLTMASQTSADVEGERSAARTTKREHN